MGFSSLTNCTAFAGSKQIAFGALREVALKAQEWAESGPGLPGPTLPGPTLSGPVLIFDDETSELIEVDLRGTEGDLLNRFSAETEAGKSSLATAADDSNVDAARKPGRPKLGVVAREVTLLPRHWEWLAGQPGGASVALRKLVEQARRASGEKDRKRLAQESAYRFISTMAGNEPGFEEAARALFASNKQLFAENTAQWPADVRSHAIKLADRVFDSAIADQTPEA